MTAVYYIGFTVLLSMVIAAPLSSDGSARDKVIALCIAAAVIHVIGFAIGYIDLGSVTFEIPGWLVWF